MTLLLVFSLIAVVAALAWLLISATKRSESVERYESVARPVEQNSGGQTGNDEPQGVPGP